MDFFENLDEMTAEVEREQEVLSNEPFSFEYKNEPNDQQRKAIEADVDAAVRVLAPPGSGKTFVIGYRYAYLVANGVNPDGIVAVTFSKDMSTELLERIAKITPQVSGTSAERQICTIHALCYRILREEGYKLRVPKDWEVKKALDEIAERLWDENERPGHKELLYWINLSKYHNFTVEEASEYFRTVLRGHGYPHPDKVTSTRIAFDQWMLKNDYLTFADMMFGVEQLFKNRPATLAKYQSRFTHVIVDEGQDTSSQAMRILTALSAPQDNFFIVGDTDQLLYRFAGATPETNLFQGFEERFPDGTLVLLETNYRSTKEIVRTCRRLIKNNYQSGGGVYEDKYMKAISAREDAPEGEPVKFQMFYSVEEESQSAIEKITDLLEQGTDPGQIFLASRTRAQLGYIEGGLVRAQVPFINVTGSSFWTMKHTADVIAYLKLALDHEDHTSFRRVYNIASKWFVQPWGEHKGKYVNHRWLGRAFLDACYGKFEYVWKAVNERKSFSSGVNDLVSFVDEIKTVIASVEEGHNPTVEALRFIIDNCYFDWLQMEEGLMSSDEAENGKLSDLETVVDVARQFEDPAEFVQYVKDAEKAAKDSENKRWDEYVVISTVHRLKGLEREVVIGVGICEGEITVGQKTVPGGLLPHTFSLTAPPQFGRLPTGGQGRIEDERCITYVLVSRAKSAVFLSGCVTYRAGTFFPSRFIAEMGLEY